MNVVTNVLNLSEPQTNGSLCPFVHMFLNFTNKNNKLGLPILKCGVKKNKDWPSSSQTEVQLAALQFVLQQNLCKTGGGPLCIIFLTWKVQVG